MLRSVSGDWKKHSNECIPKYCRDVLLSGAVHLHNLLAHFFLLPL